MEYHKNLWSDLKSSISQNYVYVLLMDIIMLIGLQVLPWIYIRILSMDPVIGFITDNRLLALNPENIPENLVRDTYIFIGKSIVLTILLVVALFYLYCYTRSALWHYVAERKLTLKHRKLFVRGNLLWFCVGVLPFVLILMLMSFTFDLVRFLTQSLIVNVILQLLVAAILLLFLNMTYVFYYELIRHRQVRTALESMIDLGVKKFHHFLGPYIIAFIGVTVLYQAGLWLMARLMFALNLYGQWWSTFYTLWSIVLGLLLLAWLRFFVDAVVQRLSPHPRIRKKKSKRKTKRPRLKGKLVKYQ
ncbi:MAG: hypothetical protein ACOCWQ_05795 [Nanoarchaeota archaeon]